MSKNIRDILSYPVEQFKSLFKKREILKNFNKMVASAGEGNRSLVIKMEDGRHVATLVLTRLDVCWPQYWNGSTQIEFERKTIIDLLVRRINATEEEQIVHEEGKCWVCEGIHLDKCPICSKKNSMN